MKRKVLAMMMSLTLAMAVTACGGSDTETDAADTAVEETVDDTAEADEAEAEHPGILSFQSILIPCPDPAEGNQQVPVSNRKVEICCDSVINEDII